jgi:hypothetical protein
VIDESVWIPSVELDASYFKKREISRTASDRLSLRLVENSSALWAGDNLFFPSDF